MNVFDLRRKIIDDYSAYVRSFISIRDARIKARVEADLAADKKKTSRYGSEPTIDYSEIKEEKPCAQ